MKSIRWSGKVGETFAARLRRVRLSKTGGFIHLNGQFRPMSQESAAHLFDVSLDCYRKWERGDSLPRRASRTRMMEIWPEVFLKEFIDESQHQKPINR